MKLEQERDDMGERLTQHLQIWRCCSAASAQASANILRTHYTTSQRAMFAERRANMTQGDGAARSHANRGESPASPNLEMQKRSVEEAAREAAVSSGAVAAARAIRRYAADEVTAAVEAGKLTLHSAQLAIEREERA